MFTALCGLPRSSRRRVVSFSSWSDGNEGGRGSIRATVSVSDADERRFALWCSWYLVEEGTVAHGRLLGLRTGAGIGLTPPIWMGGDCGRVENAAGCTVTFVLQSSDWKMTSYYVRTTASIIEGCRFRVSH